MKEYYEVIYDLYLTDEDLDEITQAIIDECKIYRDGGFSSTTKITGLSVYEENDEGDIEVEIEISEDCDIKSWYDSDEYGRRSSTYYNFDWKKESKKYFIMDQCRRRIFINEDKLDTIFSSVENWVEENWTPDDY